MTEHHGGEMEKKNATPSVRQLLCASAEKYGEEIFIKFVRNGAVEERSYVRVKTDSEAVCRWIRSISKEGMHVAVVSKTNYEYITSCCRNCVLVDFARVFDICSADVFCLQRLDERILSFHDGVSPAELRHRSAVQNEQHALFCYPFCNPRG